MRRKTLLAAGAAGAVAALALASPAASGVASTSLPTVGFSGDRLLAGATGSDAPAADRTLDSRAVDQPVAPTAGQVAAVRALLAAAPDGGRATWDDRFGTPRSLGSATGYLTGPRSGSAVEVARGFLADNAAAFGLRAADIAALAVTRDHALPGTGTHVVTFQQTWNGVASVQGGRLNVAVTKDGRVLRYTGNPVRSGSLVGDWTLSASQALGKTATALAPGIAFSPQQLGSQSGYLTFAKGPFGAGSYVKKAVFPTRDGAIPAYRIFFIKNLQTAWDTVIDARTAAILYRTSAVAHDVQSGVQSGVHSDGLVQPLVDPKGLVYENFPGSPKGGDPVVRSFGATPESPAGWVDPTGIVGPGGPTTLGNNANTYANWSNYLVPADQGPRPVDPLGQFLYSYDGNWQKTKGGTVPPSYALDLNAAATNLFYQHNRIHDEYYKLGFTETAGNFQVSNNGKGGSGGDPILGLVQAGAASGGDPTYTGRDNAYMLTLDDGIPPWSGMFLWEPIADGFEGPYRDGDLDASVIQHEYTHGLSNRYVAGGGALGSQQAGSMGEGWGDWYALNHLYATGVQDKAVVGEYVTGNTTRGIRNWNYDQNPTTYGDIGYDLTGPEVHADGEIWTATLWDLRKALVARYGAEKGGQVAAQLVTDGMPLSAPDPSYLDVRDGILAADLDRNHGDNAELIWKVFATRGEGASATTRGGDDTDPTPAFDSPYSADNGLLSVTVVNATTGKPVTDARAMLGIFEARVTPVARTSDKGRFAVPVVAGTYPLTVQAKGFGAQTFPGITVAAGKTTRLTLKLAPNLASLANGAQVVSASSEDPGLPAKFLLDDTEATVWSTADSGTPYNGGADQRVTVKLAAPAVISSLQVSAFKNTAASRFAALKDFTFQVSSDGVSWTTVKTGGFGYQTPRPTAPDLHYKTFTLATPTKASYVRFFIDSVQGETATVAQAAELQVFGTSGKVEPSTTSTAPETFTDSGTITTGNPAAGDPTGLQPVYGVTGTEFTATCSAPPASQGVDGWVTKLPAGFGDGTHTVTVKGPGTSDTTSDPVGYDLDVYFFDSSCAPIGSAASASADESGVIPGGAAYVLTQAYLGTNVPVTLTAQSTQ